jgi:hypothetical protein
MYYFYIFQYKEMKMKGLNNNLIYKPYYKQKETNQQRYQEANTQPKMQGKPMKMMMRKKKPPENITKGRFPINLQALNNHERDPRQLNNHQNLSNKHQTQQSRKQG